MIRSREPIVQKMIGFKEPMLMEPLIFMYMTILITFIIDRKLYNQVIIHLLFMIVMHWDWKRKSYYSEVSIKRTHSIKRTVCLDFQKSLLNVPYDLNLMKFITKRTVSIKRTVCKFNQRILFKSTTQSQLLVVINL